MQATRSRGGRGTGLDLVRGALGMCTRAERHFREWDSQPEVGDSAPRKPLHSTQQAERQVGEQPWAACQGSPAAQVPDSPTVGIPKT